jgi:hypothetical protein
MKSFELESFTTVKITDVVVLSQKNRDPADNPGAQLQFLAKLSNNELTQFDGALKSMLYTQSAASSAAQQGELDGVEAVTDAPNLTNIGLAIGKFHWSADLTGYELVIDHGMGGKSNITLDNCSMSGFKIDPKEGGTVEVCWTLESEDVTEGKFGKLATLKNREVKITLAAPQVDQGEIGED